MALDVGKTYRLSIQYGPDTVDMVAKVTRRDSDGSYKVRTTHEIGKDGRVTKSGTAFNYFMEHQIKSAEPHVGPAASKSNVETKSKAAALKHRPAGTPAGGQFF